MPRYVSARILTGGWPTTSADLPEIAQRLEAFRRRLHGVPDDDHADDERPAAEDAISLDWPGEDAPSSPSRAEPWSVRQRAQRFHDRRETRMRERLPSGPDKPLLNKLRRLAGSARSVVLTRHEADEVSSAAHAHAPWMRDASLLVMEELRRRCAGGVGLAGTRPLLLTGDPGIGKTEWARHLGELLGVPVIRLDVGATQTGAFSLVGVERGWGSAGIGLLTRSILDNAIVNPLVIVDEVGQAQEAVATSRGGSLPGVIPALMSLLEPGTARTWVDPYLQIGFDMSRVSFVMTTNRHKHLPQPFLDRCRVVACRNPTADELVMVLARIGAGRLWEDAETASESPFFHGFANEVRRSPRMSLRKLNRLVDRAEAAVHAPWLM